MDTKQTAGRLLGALAIVAIAACGKSGVSADDGLARDLAAAKSSGLELAPHAAAPQLVVSAIEGGPQAAPKKVTRSPVAKPVSHPAPARAATQSVAPMDVPAPRAPVVAAAPAPTQRATSERAPEPAPLPAASSDQSHERQRGTYSTEADIFRRMPWIRP